MNHDVVTADCAEEAYSYTAELSKWHRLVGSDGEQAAQEWIYQQLKDSNIEVNRERFVASDFAINIVFRFTSPILGLMLLTIYLLYFFEILDGWLSLFGSIVLILFILSMSKIIDAGFGKGKDALLGKKYETENIIGKIDAKSSKESNKTKNVIIMTHYDAKSQLFMSVIRVALFIIGILSALICSIKMLGGSILRILGESPFGSLLDVKIWQILFAFIFNFILIFNTVGNNSSGALDNASAVAVNLILAKVFKKNPPNNMNLQFVMTGSEELGLNGAFDYVQKHKNELDPENTYFIVIDSPNMGENGVLLTDYGLFKRPIDKESASLMDQVGERIGIKLKHLWLPIGAATDHIPIKKANYKVLVVVGNTSSVHTKLDSIKLINKEGLQRGAILCYEYIKMIDLRG